MGAPAFTSAAVNEACTALYGRTPVYVRTVAGGRMLCPHCVVGSQLHCGFHSSLRHTVCSSLRQDDLLTSVQRHFALQKPPAEDSVVMSFFRRASRE
jgi:hypothetical protein